MMKPAKWIGIVFLVVFSGCTWISRDYYYKNTEEAAGWKTAYRPGRGVSYEDLTYGRNIENRTSFFGGLTYEAKDPDLVISLRMGYREIISMGPLIFPIFPSFIEYDKNLMIMGRVSEGHRVKYSTRGWTVTDLKRGKTFVPSSSRVLSENLGWFTLTFPVKAMELKEFSLQLDSFTIGEKTITPPLLKLERVKGAKYFNDYLPPVEAAISTPMYLP